jgi:hypothetical protein
MTRFLLLSDSCGFVCGPLSLTRGPVCRLQFLLALASTVILGSESHVTRNHILLSQIRDFSFRRLLRLSGLRYRYSTPPPHGIPFLHFEQSQSQSHSYYRTGSLPPISSSCRQAPWDPRPEFFPQLNSCGNSPYVRTSLTRIWVDFLWMCLVFRHWPIIHVI